MNEIVLDQIKKYTFEELKEEMAEEDTFFSGTGAFVIGMTWIDYQRLKKQLEDLPDFRVIYKTFSTAHLRIVKKEQFDEFQEWRREKHE